MATLTITDTDFAAADTFLSAFMAEQVPNGDFSQGSALRDLAVKAIASLYAFFESERRTASDHSSLLKLAALPPSDEVDAAVDAYLSNLFVPRKTGSPTHLTALLHFSTPSDVTITSAIRFFRTNSLVYVPGNPDTIIIPASDLRLTTNANGSQDYTCSILLVAGANSTDYNAPPGRFVLVDKFHPFFLYAENVTAGVDGSGPETTADLIKRAPDALSTRNLVNEKSVNAVLDEQFPASLRALTVGMGADEMIRDLAVESPFPLHLGGFTDIYVGLPRTTAVENLVAGASFPRADGRVAILRDPGGGTTPFSSVRAGHVLSVVGGLPRVPRQSVVVRATPSEIEVATPFSLATDESGTDVSYAVGAFAPNFSDVIGPVPRVTGQTSRSMKEPACVFLRGQPVYRVKLVTWTDESDNVTPVTSQVNRAPLTVDEFQLEVLNPAYAQSGQAVTRLRLHPSIDGFAVQVTYDTLDGYEDVQGYVTNPFTRIIDANQLVRGYNPVYVAVSIEYQRKASAKARYDVADLEQRVADFINGFDWTDILDATQISDDLRLGFPGIGTVFPFVLRYTLLGPDGNLYSFVSGDHATLFPGTGTSAVCTNVLAVGNVLTDLGVSDRTVRYLADLPDIIVWERGFDAPPTDPSAGLDSVTSTTLDPVFVPRVS